MIKRLFVFGAALASLGAAIGFIKARTTYRRWGADATEGAKALPGDDLVPDALATDTRGIDIAAAPEAVWPWLAQMGYGRGGWYSYDQLDSDSPSADRILPEFQTLAVGDMVPVQTQPGGAFEVKVLDPGRALVLYGDRALMDAQRAARGDAVDEAADAQADFRASWAFVLEPGEAGGTRLIERFRGQMTPAPGSKGRSGSPSMPPFTGNVLDFAWFVIARRQMLGIRDRVEGRPIKPRRSGRFSVEARIGGTSPA